MKTKQTKPVFGWAVTYQDRIWAHWTADRGERSREGLWQDLRDLTGLHRKKAIKKDGYDVIRVKVQPAPIKAKKKRDRNQLAFPWENKGWL